MRTPGYFLGCTIFRTSLFWRQVHIWNTSTYNPKNRDLVVGHWTLCDAKRKWNNKNRAKTIIKVSPNSTAETVRKIYTRTIKNLRLLIFIIKTARSEIVYILFCRGKSFNGSCRFQVWWNLVEHICCEKVHRLLEYNSRLSVSLKIEKHSFFSHSWRDTLWGCRIPPNELFLNFRLLFYL